MFLAGREITSCPLALSYFLSPVLPAPPPGTLGYDPTLLKMGVALTAEAPGCWKGDE